MALYRSLPLLIIAVWLIDWVFRSSVLIAATEWLQSPNSTSSVHVMRKFQSRRHRRQTHRCNAYWLCHRCINQAASLHFTCKFSSALISAIKEDLMRRPRARSCCCCNRSTSRLLSVISPCSSCTDWYALDEPNVTRAAPSFCLAKWQSSMH